MDATANNRELALAVGRLLSDHKAEGTTVLDVGTVASWTDYLVIATARSTVHAIGLIHTVDAFLSARAVRPVNPHKKLSENGWQLLDCGDFVVHVMLQEQRDFYALEKLFFKAEVLDLSGKSAESCAASGTASVDASGTAAALPSQPRAARKGRAKGKAPRSGASGTREGHSSKSS